MTFIQWAAGGLVLVVLAVAALFVLCWHLAYKDGYNDGRDYEKQRAYLKSIRTEQGAARSRQRPERPPWYQPVLPVPWPRRVVTTAGDITPVTVVPVGPATIPLRHQPSNISGAGTIPMSALTTTGEIRAITDEFLEGLAARAARDRQEITS